MTVELPREKKVILSNQVYKMESKEVCSIREFAQFIGSLIASCPGVEYGMVHSKSFEAKLRALEENDGNFNTKMNIPHFVLKDLRWWKRNLASSCKKIKLMNFEREIFSDASKTGWGAYCNGRKAHGHWSLKQSRLHINQLELKAALLALKCFANVLSNCELILRIDNTTAMAYINKMGGVRVEYLYADAEEFWNWCEKRNLWVFVEYISSKENKEADALSRIENKNIKWELADYAFYLEITRRLRNKEDILFISFQKPHKRVMEDTLGRWIKSSLNSFGVHKEFTAYSTRHASTSRAFEKGVNIEEIKRVTGWSQNSRVFANFYKRPIILQEDTFAQTVLLPNA